MKDMTMTTIGTMTKNGTTRTRMTTTNEVGVAFARA